MAKKIICMLTVLSIVFSSLPILTVTAEEAVKTATQITSAEQLVDGQYVIVTETNFAMTVFDSTWVLSKAVTPVDGKLTDVTSDMIWDVTTDGASVTLTDSNGASIAPKGGNNNGIKSGEYSWSIIFNDGMFQFAGVDADTVRLSANVASDSKFRAYKNTTIDKSPNSYIANFYIFAIDAEGGSDIPDVPDVPDTPDVPETNEYGTSVSTGSCGESVDWTLYDSGTLVISGTGAMYDYDYYGDIPWYEHRSSIKNIIIEDSVTTIGDSAFYQCTSLTSVTIGSSVTTIGDYAFSDCTSLTSVTIPSSVTAIGNGAFSCCSSLASVTIPNSVTTIGDYAFQWCASLTSVTIPDSVTTIGDNAFGRCQSLASISVGVNNKNYSSDEDGVLFNKEKTQLIQYPIGKTRTSYTIPDSVTTIGDGAFELCESLTSVTIPNSVTAIGIGAFSNCYSLTSVTIPDSVTTIGDGAFLNCTNLTSVTIGKGVAEIGEGAFDLCESLNKVIYAGTKSMWENIAIGSYNDPLLNAEIVYLPVEAEGIEISSLPSKLEYAYGESLSLDGIVVKVYFSDGTVAETTEYTVSEFNKYSYGKQTLTVFYGELFAEFSVTVKAQKAPVSDSTVALGMTVGELKASYGEQTVYVLSSDGKTVLSDSDVVKTGSVVQVVQDGAVVDSVALVVESDVDGDGRLTAKDFIRLKKQIAQGSWVEYPEYADINRDGVVDTLDLEALALAIS